MRAKCEYGIYDGDELLAKGSAEFLQRMYGLYAIQYANRGCLYKFKYRIVNLGKFTENRILSDKLQITKAREEALNNAVLMMYKYGNLYANDPEEYRKVLNDNNIKFTYWKCSDGVGYHLERRYE